MEQQFTVSDFAVPMVMLGCTTVIAIIGYLLSRQMTRIDDKLAEHSRRLYAMELAWTAKFGTPPKKPSDLILKVSGGDTA